MRLLLLYSQDDFWVCLIIGNFGVSQIEYHRRRRRLATVLIKKDISVITSLAD